MKATHKGHCQICDRVVKAPAGFIAKHGYTVNRGMFNGNCPGSDCPTYEKETRVLEGHVLTIERRISAVDKQIAEHRNRNGTEFMYRNYFSNEKCYRWTLATATATDDGRCRIELPGGHVLRNVSMPYTENPEQLALHYNTIYMEHLESDRKQLADHRSWCLHRIKNWALAPLIPMDAKR